VSHSTRRRVAAWTVVAELVHPNGLLRLVGSMTVDDDALLAVCRTALPRAIEQGGDTVDVKDAVRARSAASRFDVAPDDEEMMRGEQRFAILSDGRLRSARSPQQLARSPVSATVVNLAAALTSRVPGIAYIAASLDKSFS